MDLDNNAHSVFLLHYHLVLVVKYRRQVFDDAISGRAKEIFAYIAPNYNITLEEWNQRPCAYTFQGPPQYGNKQVHKRI